MDNDKMNDFSQICCQTSPKQMYPLQYKNLLEVCEIFPKSPAVYFMNFMTIKLAFCLLWKWRRLETSHGCYQREDFSQTWHTGAPHWFSFATTIIRRAEELEKNLH